MTAFTRIFSTSTVIVSCIAALWIGFLAAALLSNPIASQTSKAHRLGLFSEYILNLVHYLQLEQAASADFVATAQAGQLTGRLRDRHRRTDVMLQGFEKTWGRFNASDYGPVLTSSLEAAGAQLSRLDEMRSGVMEKKADVLPAIDAYSQAIEQLITAISQLETVQLEAPAAVRSREAFLGFLKAGELSAREMTLSPPIEVSTDEWLESFERKHNRLIGLAYTELRELRKKTGAEAVRRANFFIISLLVVVSATLGAIAWHRPSALNQSLLICLILFNITLALWTLTTDPSWMSKESGPIESLQAVVLIIAFALFCRDAIKHPGASRPVAVTMACLCFLMAFREIDLRIFDAPDWLITITTGQVRIALSVILAALTVIYALTCYRHAPGLVRSSLTWRAWPFYIWPLLIVAGEQVELRVHATRQDDLPGYWANGQFWEELLELNAYIAILYAAYIFAEIFRSGGKQRA